MRRYISFGVLLLFAAFLLPSARGLDNGKTLTQYAHRIWDSEAGLSQPTVYAILQSRNGYLWLGTQDSLQRSDGVQFNPVASESGAPLHRALVRSLWQDAGGTIWAGTIGSGLVRILPNGQVSRVNSVGANTFCLVPGEHDRPGATDLWVCGDGALTHIDGNAITTVNTANGLPAAVIHDTCLDSHGDRWAATEEGLFHSRGSYRRGSAPFALYPTAAAKPAIVSALACNHQSGTVWAGTAHGLLEIPPVGSKAASKLWTQQQGLPNDNVLTLLPGHDGTLWVGTADGMARLQHDALSVYRTENGLSHSLVLAFCEDREGNLWAGTKNGLDQFADSAITPYRTDEGLSENSAGPLAQDQAGQLWVGTAHTGLNRFAGGHFYRLGRADGLLSDTILSLAPDPNGDLWAGTSRGLNRLHGNRVSASIAAPPIRALVFDSAGQLWAGTGAGLLRFEHGRLVHAHMPGLPSASDITSLFAGQQVRLFVGTDEPSLYALRRNGSVIHDSREIARPVDALFPDSELHESWMGTLGSGLVRWKAGVLKRVRVKDGLYDNRIYAILRDDRRFFWIASSKGIFRVSQHDLDDFADGRRPFVDSMPFTAGQLRFECQSGVQPAAIRTANGQLWFATNRGLVRIDAHQLAPHAVPPLTRIEAVLVDGRQAAQTPDLPVGILQRNLAIRYAGLSFRAPEKVTFRYRLLGFEKTWTEAGARREAFFTNLPPGNFIFQVQARSGDGVWSISPAVLRFHVEPRFYQRRWFFPALVLLLAAIAGIGYRLRIRRLQRNFQIVLAERTRIARELHDTLLQGLTAVTMQMQGLLLKMPTSREKTSLAEIISDASYASSEARRGLLGLRSTGAPPVPFARKLAISARQCVKGHALRLRLDLDQAVPALPPAMEHQLLRIAGEALANILAHARASEAFLALRVTPESLQLTIADDGVGFDPAAARKVGHFGLEGMEERATEIDGHLCIESAPGAGTRLSVLVRLPVASMDASSGRQIRNRTPAPAHQD